MDFNGICKMFTSSEHFPKHLCVVEDKDDEGYFYSDKWFLCLCISEDSSIDMNIRIMKPFMLKTDRKLGLAWIDEVGQTIDNYLYALNYGRMGEYVVGFIEYSGDIDNDFIVEQLSTAQDIYESRWKTN